MTSPDHLDKGAMVLDSEMRNDGQMKEIYRARNKTGATETELPTPLVTTDIPKEGVISEQDPVGGIQQNSQTHSLH